MAKTTDIETLRPSVFDRLIDHEPDRKVPDSPKPRSQLVRELCAAVCRDLSFLLNTRPFHPHWPAGLDELKTSCLAYGIPDFTGANLASEGARDELRRRVEGVIRRYEPRFTRVTVTLLDNIESGDRALRLRIDAVLRADTVHEPIVFDSVVDPASGGVAVEGQFDE